MNVHCAAPYSLNYEDKVVDGFYDLWGEFTQASDGNRQFPSLEALRRIRLPPGDRREVSNLPLVAGSKRLHREAAWVPQCGWLYVCYVFCKQGWAVLLPKALQEFRSALGHICGVHSQVSACQTQPAMIRSMQLTSSAATIILGICAEASLTSSVDAGHFDFDRGALFLDVFQTPVHTHLLFVSRHGCKDPDNSCYVAGGGG